MSPALPIPLGNIFDWGAKAVSDLLEGNVTFGLRNAMQRINDHPWINNGLPEFLHTIKVNPLTISLRYQLF